MASGNIPTKEEVEPTMSQIKSAYLKNEFKISKSALYDYYSTNSGIFARNLTIDGKGGGGGDDPSGLAERVEVLEDTASEHTGDIRSLKATASSHTGEIGSLKTTTSNHTRQLNTVSEDINEISGNIDGVVTMKENMVSAAQNGLDSLSDFTLSSSSEYNEIDDIISDQDILKKVQENFLSAVVKN